MNINSKDVVKNVESNNVESTSNEQRQTNKPIVISRRRLLRAGVAGIPVVLTMAGVAPGQFGGGISAASGLNYDGMSTLGRFSKIHDDVLRDNLIYSDEDGFIYKREGGYYEVSCQNSSVTPTSVSGVSVSISLIDVTSVGDPVPDHSPSSNDLAFTLTFNEGAITYPARLNKNGNYYTQQNWFTINKEKIVAELSNNGHSEYTISDIVTDNETVTIGDLSTTDWPVAENPWRVVPSESKEISVTFSATTAFTYKYPSVDPTVTYSGTVNISLTFPATVAVPTLTFEKRMDWE